jgi:hypothetical protein
VSPRPDRIQALATDRKLQFITDSMEGDLQQGLTLIVNILQDEAVENLHAGLAENKT